MFSRRLLEAWSLYSNSGSLSLRKHITSWDLSFQKRTFNDSLSIRSWLSFATVDQGTLWALAAHADFRSEESINRPARATANGTEQTFAAAAKTGAAQASPPLARGGKRTFAAGELPSRSARPSPKHRLVQDHYGSTNSSPRTSSRRIGNLVPSRRCWHDFRAANYPSGKNITRLARLS